MRPRDYHFRMWNAGDPSYRTSGLVLAVSTVLWLCTSLALGANTQSGNLVPLVPSPKEIVDEIVRVAQARKGMTIADLGCGDGRIVVAVARQQASAICIENDPQVMERAKQTAESAGVTQSITFLPVDLRDFVKDSSALAKLDVVVLYLSSELNQEIADDLQRNLKSSALVISHAYPIRNWKAREVRPVWIASTRNTSRLYIYELRSAR